MHTLLLGLALLAQPFTTPHGSSATTSSFTFKDDAEAYFGTDLDYWWVYNSASTQYELQSSNVDGAGTNGIVCLVNDGTDDVAWTGGASFAGAISSCTGDVTCPDNNGIVGGQRTTDAAPQGLLLRPQPAFPGGTQSAAHIVAAAGQDETTIAIDGADPSVTCAGDNDTVTVVIYNSNGKVIDAAGAEVGTGILLTEGSDTDGLAGTDWTASASVAATCASLATGINALPLIGATCTSPNVRITLDPTTAIVTLAESTAACTTVGVGTAGQVLVRDGAAATPAIAFASDLDTGWYSGGANILAAGAGGAVRVQIGTTSVTFAGISVNASGANFIVNDVLDTTGAFTKGALTRAGMSQESLTFAANPGDASKVTSGLIPAGATLHAVTARVTTTGTNCASWSAGDGTTANQYSNATALSAGTTMTAANALAATSYPTFSPTAREVTITANVANCYSLVVRVTAHYLLATADTAN